jgi:hypothetical protein
MVKIRKLERDEIRKSSPDLENEGRQLIERVTNLQAHQNERCHHQIETKMHEDLLGNSFLPTAQFLRSTGNQTQYSTMNDSRETLGRVRFLVNDFRRPLFSPSGRESFMQRFSKI